MPTERPRESGPLVLLLLAASAGSIAAVFGILRGRKWGWLLGALAAALDALFLDGFGRRGPAVGTATVLAVALILADFGAAHDRVGAAGGAVPPGRHTAQADHPAADRA